MTIETTRVNSHLAQHDPTGVLTPSEAVTSAIHAWVSGLDIAVQGAQFIVDTPACPDSFWPLPPDVKIWQIPGKNPKLRLPNESEESFLTRRRIAAETVGFVVRYGLGLGLAPEVSLNGIFVIGGRPSMYADQMVALIKSHGHKHRVVERSAERCVVRVKHRDESEWEEFTFTMQDAIGAGYVKGKGPNKDNKSGNDKYNLDPKAMLYARASSIACKAKFPETLRGMATYEELQDERSQERDEVRTITTVTAKDIKKRAALAAPTQPAETTPAADPEPTVPMLDARQWDAINRRFVELEVVGDGQKAARLTVISRIVDRPIARGGELTATEGQLVLDNLAGNLGFEVVGQALGTPAATEPVTDDAEPDDTTTDDAEPTDQEWDAMGGAEAEAEASRG